MWSSPLIHFSKNKTLFIKHFLNNKTQTHFFQMWRLLVTYKIFLKKKVEAGRHGWRLADPHGGHSGDRRSVWWPYSVLAVWQPNPRGGHRKAATSVYRSHGGCQIYMAATDLSSLHRGGGRLPWKLPLASPYIYILLFCYFFYFLKTLLNFLLFKNTYQTNFLL